MIELLSPAGSMEALRAAVQNGANAVYLGYDQFNARMNAKNFSADELQEAIVYCHVRGVAVHLTLNTLVADREMARAADVIRLAATLGVVLPSFVIILVIAALIRNFLQYAGVQAFLSGVRPCVVAMILATAVTMGLKSLVQFQRWGDRFTPDWKSLAIFVLLWAVHLFWKKTRKKAPSPMAMIGLSALMGILFFGLA